jgi:hypothetical protein
MKDLPVTNLFKQQKPTGNLGRMRQPRHARRTLAALMGACAVSACGGGSGGAASGGQPATTAAETNKIFIDPAGPLCAQRDTLSGHCIQPTSSSMSLAALQAAIVDPAGQTFTVDTFGSSEDANIKSFRGMYMENTKNFTLQKKTFVFGKKQTVVDGKTFDYEKHYAGDDDKFYAGTDPLDVRKSEIGTFFLSFRNTTAASMGPPDAAGPTTTDVAVTSFGGTLGLLTDKHDAPVEAEITYKGNVYVYGGDGGVEGPPSLILRMTAGSCPMTLVLDTASGALTSAPVKCTDPLTNLATIQFELPRLQVENSRVGPLLGTEVSASIAGYAGNFPELSPISAVFRTGKIEGGLFNAGARNLSIIGVGPLGQFEIRATRQ